MQKITPHLWFDKEAKEAAISIHPFSRIRCRWPWSCGPTWKLVRSRPATSEWFFPAQSTRSKKTFLDATTLAHTNCFLTQPSRRERSLWTAGSPWWSSFGNCAAVCKLAGHRAQDFRLCWLSGVICGGTSHSLFLNPGFSESASSKCASVAPGRYCGLLPACSRSGGPTRWSEPKRRRRSQQPDPSTQQETRYRRENVYPNRCYADLISQFVLV